MAENNADKVLKDLEKGYKLEAKEHEEYEKWVSKMKKEDYSDLAWEVAWETLSIMEDHLEDLLGQIIDISTNL